jgi:AbrB family looped-hinge helix DNA binding protein
VEARVDSVGRIVVPKPLRDALGLRPGATVDISRYGAGLTVVPTGRTARLLDERFPRRLVLGADTGTGLPDILGRLGIAGGAVYDAIVALAAAEHSAQLATRDGRARATYEAIGVEVTVAA